MSDTNHDWASRRIFELESRVGELEALLRRCLAYAPAPYFHDIERDIRATVDNREGVATANAALRKALNDEDWEVDRFGPRCDLSMSKLHRGLK